MNLLKTKARFLIPIVIIAGAYVVSSIEPNVAVKKPEIAAPKAEAPIIPSTSVPVIISSQPPGEVEIRLTVSVPRTNTQITEAAPDITIEEPAVTPPAEPAPTPSIIEDIVDKIIAIIPPV